MDKKTMWERQFKNLKIGSKPIQVVVTTWDRIDLTVYCTNVNQGPVCFVDVLPSQNDKGIRRTKFDFILVRAPIKTIESDFTNILHGFNFASVPSSNQFTTSFSFLHRPFVFAGNFSKQKVSF